MTIPAIEDEVQLTWKNVEASRMAEVIRLTARRNTTFRYNKRFLIGHPNRDSNDLMEVKSDMRHTLVTSMEFMRLQATSYLSLTANCNHGHAGIKALERRHRKFHPIGSTKARFELDGVNVGASVGRSPVVIPIVAQFKRRPGQTYKGILIHQSKNNDLLKPILSLRVGVETSACTRNTQRLSLENVLILAFPHLMAKLRKTLLKCDFTDEDAAFISGLIGLLETTGWTQSGLFCHYWPASGAPTSISLLDHTPEWQTILRDTHLEACFAVLSDRCLWYAEKGPAYRKRPRLASCTRGRHANPKQRLRAPGFHTTIDIDHAKLSSGDVFLRGVHLETLDSSVSRETRLVFFRGHNLVTKTLQLLDREGHTSEASEVLNPELPSEHLNVFIIDMPTSSPGFFGLFGRRAQS